MGEQGTELALDEGLDAGVASQELGEPADPDVVQAEVERAQGILQAMEAAERDGRGAVSYNGKMIDFASMRHAETVVRKATMISEKVQ